MENLEIVYITIGVLLIIITAILLYRLINWMLTPELHVKKVAPSLVDMPKPELAPKETESQATESAKKHAFECLKFQSAAYSCYRNILMDFIKCAVDGETLIKDRMLSLLGKITSDSIVLENLESVKTSSEIVLETHLPIIYQSCSALVECGNLLEMELKYVCNAVPGMQEFFVHVLSVQVMRRRSEMLLELLYKDFDCFAVDPTAILDSPDINSTCVNPSLSQ